ncbi:AimR family lysis-lysogeny pheromone receptor [Bacillus altitudinis]|uniref:AimR family lysis-lysogeny pheromone receptor n=1 Tax=Bacillus altitudinis TaxID=293387 RepID=UPI00114EABAF|nr:AimR family lysis-lysogeny pheromone receptor [Bacillus altitudinis]MBR0581335.1 XRE family transcriptional regulator [Bacillus altitudinis A23-8]
MILKGERMHSTVKNDDIRDVLKKHLDKMEKSQNSIAKAIGITKGYMSKFFSGKEIAFWMVIETVREISPSEEKQLMKEYSKSGFDKKYIYSALEYYYTNQMFNEIRYIIDNYSSVAADACNAYRFALNFRESFKPLEHQRALNNLKAKTIEGKTLLEIFESYVYYNIGKYDLSLYSIDRAKEFLKGINDPFLKKSFKARIDEILANTYLKQENNIEKARDSAMSLMKTGISKSHVMTATYLLGLSYFFESYKKSLNYYKQLLKLYEEFPEREEEVIQNKEEIAILQYYWCKKIDEDYNVTHFTQVLSEGSSLKLYYLDKSLRPYAYLFDGIREVRTDKILLSLHFFSEQRDYFRANIPKIQLKKMDLDLTL